MTKPQTAGSDEDVHPWYRYTDRPRPPLTVIIEVMWRGWVGRAALVPPVSNKTGKTLKPQRWVARDKKGNTIDLPPAWVDAAHNPHPDLWRPIAPLSWTLPLPEPVWGVTPAMWSSHTEFSAAEAAAEMEAQRERAGRDCEDDYQGLPWWRNPARVTYSPAGTISREEAEGRIMRALAGDTSRHVADGTGLHRPQYLLHMMDDEAIRRLVEIEAHTPHSDVQPFTPLQADVKDFMLATSWFTALGAGAATWTRQQLVLWFASRGDGRSFSDIGSYLVPHVSRQRAHQIYAHAIGQITLIANGAMPEAVAARDAALDAVRAANRQARRERSA